MNPYLLSILLAVAALALLAYALSNFLRARAKIARRSGALDERIARAKTQLEQARERAATGEITPERFDEIERYIGAKLLEGDTWTASLQATRVAVMNRMALSGAGTLLLAGLAIGIAVWQGGRVAPPTADATAPVAAADVAAPPASGAASASAAARPLSDEQLQRMIDQAAAKVRQDPKDSASWAMLAHSYDMLGKFAESSKAYARLAALLPKDAQVLADYADALGVANGRSLMGEPTALIAKALALDARNVKALALSGTAAFERGDYADAVDAWQRARDASRDPTFTRQIETSIGEAKAALKGEPPVAARAASGAAPKGATISGRVTLADDLVAKARPDATVFIFARPAKGSRMPVAILRKRVRDLPAEFTLDDSMSMVPDAKLSRQASVVVGARVSQRGDVTPQAGDMQGWSAPVAVGATGLRLEISEVLK